MTGAPHAVLPADLEVASRLAAQLTARQAGWLAAGFAAVVPGLLHPGPALLAGVPVGLLALAVGWLAPAGRTLPSWAGPLAGYLARRLR